MKRKKESELVSFNVDTMALLHEIADSGLHRSAGVLKVPLNIFKNLLAQVAQRATELNDPKLNILMLKLKLYEVPHREIQNAIKKQKELIEKK